MRYENIHTKIRGGERGVLLLIVSQRVSQPPKCVCVCVCFLARADLHIYTHFLSHSITHTHTRECAHKHACTAVFHVRTPKE